MKKHTFTWLMVIAIIAVLAAAASPRLLQTGGAIMRVKASSRSTQPEPPESVAANLHGGPVFTGGSSAAGSSAGEGSSSDADDHYGPVSPPDRPDGPSSGKVKKKLKYDTEGSEYWFDHYYMYDWDDGSSLKWSKDEKQSHTYKKSGTYHIRVKERCPLWYFVTDWSKERKVKISK